MDKSPDSGKRAIFGLQINMLESTYGNSILLGVNSFARDNNIDLIVFPGNSVNSPFFFEYQENVVYDAIPLAGLDALILCTGTLSNFIGKEEIKQFIFRMGNIPMVSIGVEVETLPSILTDNKIGINLAVQHLVKDHKMTRIAFIKGPESNPEAQDRLEGYLTGMQDSGLTVDPELILPGDFTTLGAELAVRQLLDQNKTPFEAIIAANDDMALKVVELLETRGIEIPGKAAVIGFDNISETYYSHPPLTTVRQPLVEIGRKAAEYAYLKYKGESVPLKTLLPVELIVRESCGCSSALKQAAYISARTGGIINDKVSMLSRIKEFVFTYKSRLEQGVDYEYPEFSDVEPQLMKIIECLEMPGEQEMKQKCFITLVEKIITQEYKKKRPMELWKHILDDMRSYFLNLDKDQAKQSFYHAVFDNVQVEVIEKNQLGLAAQKSRFHLKLFDLRVVLSRIIGCNTTEELVDGLLEILPRFEIRNGLIAFYTSETKHRKFEKWVLPSEAAVYFAFNSEGQINMDPSQRIYQSNKALVPDWFYPMPDRKTMVLKPLYFREDQLGLFFFELGKLDGIIYETLCIQLSSLLKNYFLRQDLEEQKNNLQLRNKVIEEDLEMAKKLQLHLIPVYAAIQGVCSFYKPMDKVGGDFFDFIRFKDPDLLGIFISDVSGHGVTAAFITSMIKALLSQFRLESFNPAALLTVLNSTLYGKTSGNFVTAFYGLYNRRTRELNYANAGHNSPLYLNRYGYSYLSTNKRSMPLASFDNESLERFKKPVENELFSMEPGEKLIFYTDGMMEAFNEKDERENPDGEKASFEACCLPRVLEGLSDKRPREIIKTLEQELIKYRGKNEFRDDVCIICLEAE